MDKNHHPLECHLDLQSLLHNLLTLLMNHSMEEEEEDGSRDHHQASPHILIRAMEEETGDRDLLLLAKDIRVKDHRQVRAIQDRATRVKAIRVRVILLNSRHMGVDMDSSLHMEVATRRLT